MKLSEDDQLLLGELCHQNNVNLSKVRKGNSNLEDYLIPVIKLMWNGHDHKEAFRIIKEKLNVRYNTVSSQCPRALGLTTEDFIERVESKTIVDLIEYKYPDQYQKIKLELKR